MGLFDNADDKIRDMKDKLNHKDDAQRTDSTGMAGMDDSDMDTADTTGGGAGFADDRTSGTRMQDDSLGDADRDSDMNLRREYTDTNDSL